MKLSKLLNAQEEESLKREYKNDRLIHASALSYTYLRLFRYAGLAVMVQSTKTGPSLADDTVYSKGYNMFTR